MKKILGAGIIFGMILSGCSMKANTDTQEKQMKESDVLAATENENSQEKLNELKMRVEDGYIQYFNGSSWENLIAVADLKGEKGDKGDPGTNGINGKNGVNGVNGINGIDGKNGANGVNGKDGTNGTNGVNGKNGIDGKDGKDGKDGRDGVDAVVNPGITRTFNLSTQTILINSPSHSLLGFANPGKLVINDYSNVVFQEDYSGAVEGYAPGSPTSLSFDMNEDGYVTVTATPYDGFVFSKWSDGNTNAKRKITYNDKLSIEAIYLKVKAPDDTNLYYPQDSNSSASGEIPMPTSTPEPTLEPFPTPEPTPSLPDMPDINMSFYNNLSTSEILSYVQEDTGFPAAIGRVYDNSSANPNNLSGISSYIKSNGTYILTIAQKWD